MNAKAEKFWGVVFSYIGSGIQMVITLYLPAFLISELGETTYGIYQMIVAFIGNLHLFNFGISTVVSRTITRCRTEKTEINNALHTGIITAAVITVITAAVAFALIPLMALFYKDSLTFDQMHLAKLLSVWLIFSSLLYIWQRMFYGIMIGYEKFAFTNSLQFIIQIIRVCIIVLLVIFTHSVIMIAVAEVIVQIIHIIIEIMYCFKKLDIKFKFVPFIVDKVLLKIAILFGIASFLQSITRQINNSMDKMILGIKMLPSDVAMYSTGLTLMTAYITLTKLISAVYLPDATKLTVKNAVPEEYEKMMLFPMKLQAFLSMAILFGFISVGREFYTVWIGKEYTKMWLPVIIIYLPLSIANLSSIPDIILDAKLKKLLRSIALLLTAIINLVISLLLVDKYGFYGVAFGTSLSFLLGNVIIMGFVYIKNIGVDIFRIYLTVVWKPALAGIIACVISLILLKLIEFENLTEMLLGGSVFVLVYLVLLFLGLDENEQKQFNDFKHKIQAKFQLHN